MPINQKLAEEIAAAESARQFLLGARRAKAAKPGRGRPFDKRNYKLCADLFDKGEYNLRRIEKLTGVPNSTVYRYKIIWRAS